MYGGLHSVVHLERVDSAARAIFCNSNFIVVFVQLENICVLEKLPKSTKNQEQIIQKIYCLRGAIQL